MLSFITRWYTNLNQKYIVLSYTYTGLRPVGLGPVSGRIVQLHVATFKTFHHSKQSFSCVLICSLFGFFSPTSQRFLTIISPCPMTSWQRAYAFTENPHDQTIVFNFKFQTVWYMYNMLSKSFIASGSYINLLLNYSNPLNRVSTM